MERTIPWIGYNFYGRTISLDIEERSKLQVEKLRLANDGLEKVLNQAYPVILVQDVMAAGDTTILPETVLASDPIGISCYVIRTIKKSSLNQKTPVIALGSFINGYNPEQRYLEAGADMVIDLSQSSYKKPANEILKILKL